MSERTLAEEKIAHVTRMYRVLSRVNGAIVRVRDPKELFQEVCRIVVEDGSFQGVWLALFDRNTGQLSPAAQCGVLCEPLEDVAARSMELVEETDNRFSVFPLWLGTKALGVIGICPGTTRRFEMDEISLLKELSDSISFAIQSIDLEEQRKRAEEGLALSLSKLREAMEGIIQAMSMVTEIRDPYTAGHQRRVGKLAAAIAKKMGLTEREIEGIRLAGTIHDIGKISVPAEILSKPGRMTAFEFSIVKAHAETGYDILKTIEFPWPIAQIVHQHHERMDGSGYPSGLVGEEILLEARILTVADVVEAMASHRPYRPALGVDKALEEISRNRGILYDPDVVDACVSLCGQESIPFK